MRSLYGLLIIGCFNVLNALGQEVFVSEDIGIRNDFGYEILTGWPEDQVMLFRDRLLKYDVEMYDSTLHLKWEKEIDLQRGFTAIIGVVKLDTSFALLYSYRHEGRIFIAMDYFDSRAELLRQTTLYQTARGLDLSSFKWAISEDNSRGVIFYKKGDKGLFIIPVNLKSPRMRSAIELTFEEQKWRKYFKGVAVTNAGDMAFAFDMPQRWYSMKERELAVYLINSEGEIEVIKIPPDEAKLLNTTLSVDNRKQRFVLAGTYGKDRKSEQATGFWVLKISVADTSRDEITFLPFSNNLVKKLTGNRVSKGKGYLEVTDIVLRSDGGVVLFGEVRKKYKRRPELTRNLDISGPGMRGWIDYYYEDVVAMSVHPTSDKHWEEVLYKHQYSQDDEAIYSSFFIMKNPAILRLLYNDDVSGSQTVSEYLLSSEGVLDRKTLLNTTRQKLWLRWRDAYQTKYNELIVPSQGYNTLNLVKIRF